MREQELAWDLRKCWQDINLLLEKDRRRWEEVNHLEQQLEGMDLRVGALKAQVDHMAPMVINLTEEEPEVRQELVELVLPPAPPVVQQALDVFGAGLLQAVAEWGADEEVTEIGLDNDDVIIYNLEGAVVEIRDFAEEERAQAQEPGLTEAMEVERAAAFLALEYEDPPAYEP